MTKNGVFHKTSAFCQESVYEECRNSLVTITKTGCRWVIELKSLTVLFGLSLRQLVAACITCFGFGYAFIQYCLSKLIHTI